MKIKMKKIIISISVCILLIFFIILYINNKDKKIEFKYAILVSPTYNVAPANSRIVFLDEKGNKIHEKKLGKYGTTNFIREGNSIELMPMDREEIVSLNLETNKLSTKSILSYKEDNSEKCSGRVEDIIKTKNGNAYIINYGIEQNDGYTYKILIDKKCYSIPIYLQYNFYDREKNKLNFLGSNTSNLDNPNVEYKFYQLDLERKELKNIELSNSKDFSITLTHDGFGIIKDNNFYTIDRLYDNYDSVKENYDYRIYLGKYDLNNFKRIDQKEIGQRTWKGIKENTKDSIAFRNPYYFYHNNMIYFNDLEKDSFVYKVYDLNFNLVKTLNMNYKGNILEPLNDYKFVGDELYFTAYYKQKMYIFIYDLKEGKYKKKIKANFKFSDYTTEVPQDMIIN